jgi:hypothetical protein
MAKFGFGLNVNETAQENGYDQYQVGLKESLGAVAADNWELNPAMATFKNWQIYKAKSISEEGERSPFNQPIFRVNREKLNKQYSSLGLYFEQDEYQSVVDIMVDNKIEENERKSIMSRGPQGSFNPLSGGFYVGAAKLAVGIGVSFLDPINIGVSFIPVVGQARFAQIAARTGLKTARAVRGAVEGAVGATILEPLIYSTAQKIQADYDLVDSFMNIGFGTIIGTGLHVGAGALKDIGTAQKFEAQIIKNRENLEIEKNVDQEKQILKNIDDFVIDSKKDYFAIYSKTKELTKEFTGIPASQVEKFIIQAEYVKKLNAMQINDVKISKKYRNTGAGKALYKIAIKDAFDKNLDFASDNSISESALRVYKSLEKEGFKVVYNKNIKVLKNEVKLDQGRGDQIQTKDGIAPVVIIKKPISKSVPELNLYNQYYPVNGEFMMKLEKTDPRTRELLLAKAIGDLSLENPVNVGSILDADATLREGTANPATGEIKSTTRNTFNDADINPVNKNIDNLTSAENDIVINRESQDLLDLRNRQTEQGLILKTDFGSEGIPDVLTNTTEALDDFNANSKQVEETIKDFINCENGNT